MYLSVFGWAHRMSGAPDGGGHAVTPLGTPRGRSRRGISTGTGVGLSVALLGITHAVGNCRLPPAGPTTAPVACTLLLGVLFWSGGTWGDAGPARDSLGRGLRWTLALTGLVGVVYPAGALLPATRGLFADARYSDLTGGDVALRVLITVPVGTVLLEEAGSRGVLYGLVRRVGGTVRATSV
ncbi:hypothetical protein [Streptomyces kebangsaanensis]|uniref:hypothetical protein n=1 Tax=Streptomyces kebangsaanensis TaxID=864058 RepID=UPI000AD79B86|nr:hypothetical protein [Streptomyces kebangsaanensis]